MTKPELMKQLEAVVDEAIARRMWGLTKITWKDGEPDTLRTEFTRKFTEGGLNEHKHAKQTFGR